MADAPTARDVDRLPWLEPFGESERKRGRRPVSRTALVGLLVAFFGVGLAVAFSLGYRVARPSAETPVPVIASRQPDRIASAEAPPSAPTPAPVPPLERAAPPPVTATPVVTAPKPKAATPRPVIKKARARAKAKAPRRYAKRQPILRPFDLTRRPPPPPAAPIRALPQPAPTPRGRVIQVGAYSTPRKADAAWRSLVFRYPYLGKKPKVIAPTPPVGGWRYYRLRLGTETHAQSLVICQHLQSRGQSCIVIY